jgi:hypothetical protein
VNLRRQTSRRFNMDISMQIQRFLAGSALALAFAVASAPANAAVIVDTGKPVNGAGVDWWLNATQSLAAKFTVTTATRLTDLAGYMFAYSAPGTFTVAVRADGDTPGAVLFSDTAVAKLSLAFYGVHGESWLVGPGSYWLAFEVRPDNTLYGFMPSNPASPLGPEAYTEDGSYYRYDDLELGVRISGDAVSVPEPAAWALMLTGFLGAGAALRSARRRQAALTA